MPDLPAMSECFKTIPSPVLNFSYSKSNTDLSYLHHIMLQFAVHLKIIVHLFGILICRRSLQIYKRSCDISVIK